MTLDTLVLLELELSTATAARQVSSIACLVAGCSRKQCREVDHRDGFVNAMLEQELSVSMARPPLRHGVKASPVNFNAVTTGNPGTATRIW
jgi:hypothetical protein